MTRRDFDRAIGPLVRRMARELAELDAARPRTRGECEDGMRPCPFVACRYNLFCDTTDAGSLTFNFPGVEPEDLAESCALDVADRGEHTLETVGELLNLTHERIRQLEVRALHALKQTGAIAEAAA